MELTAFAPDISLLEELTLPLDPERRKHSIIMMPASENK
jgi:hypothetical protein